MKMTIRSIIRNRLHQFICYTVLSFVALSSTGQSNTGKSPVDHVNPYMGNISHLLVPTYPTVHLPN
ncbi:MAG TPA: hypothetical protein PKE30_17860, partial [Niabella sp.]|nr:hypothetical protein [Niabella sp.]